MEKMKFTAILKTPIIFRGYLTFDALLGALLFDRMGGEPEEAHAKIPIKKTNGLYHASAAIIEGGEDRIEKVSFSASLRAKHDLDPRLLKKNRDGKKLHHKLDEKRKRNFGNVFNTYRAISTPSVSWYCEGDRNAIEDILRRDARYIGKRRASGFGKVAEWKSATEAVFDGLMDNNKPMRPIPADMFTGDRSLPVLDTAWKPAYWNPANRAPCYAPPLIGQGAA